MLTPSAPKFGGSDGMGSGFRATFNDLGFDVSHQSPPFCGLFLSRLGCALTRKERIIAK